MKFKRGALYKLVEFPFGMALVEINTTVKMPNQEELVAADLPTIVEYLNRYFEFRQLGLPLVEAHAKALEGANVLSAGRLNDDNKLSGEPH